MLLFITIIAYTAEILLSLHAGSPAGMATITAGNVCSFPWANYTATAAILMAVCCLLQLWQMALLPGCRAPKGLAGLLPVAAGHR
jgi:hypothetical protein